MFKYSLKLFELKSIQNFKWFSTSLISRLDDKNLLANIKSGIDNLKIYDEIDLLPAELDWNYLLDVKNLKYIEENNKIRKGVGDIYAVVRFINNSKILEFWLNFINY